MKVIRHIKLLVAISYIFASGLFVLITPVSAVDCASVPDTPGCPCAPTLEDGSPNPAAQNSSICPDLKKTDDSGVNSIFHNVANILLYIAGLVAVVMIVISGIRFVSSHGDPGAVTKARSTLLYSIIGLIITVIAFSIVNFILGRL